MDFYIPRTMIYTEKIDKMTRHLKQLNAMEQLIISWDWRDSFWTPKDIAQWFFSAIYELKESFIKDDAVLVIIPDIKTRVENFIGKNQIAGLSIDIANSIKHIKLSKPWTNKKIGRFNTWLSILSYLGDKTSVTIEIDGKAENISLLVLQVSWVWKDFTSGIDKIVQEYYRDKEVE